MGLNTYDLRVSISYLYKLNADIYALDMYVGMAESNYQWAARCLRFFLFFFSFLNLLPIRFVDREPLAMLQPDHVDAKAMSIMWRGHQYSVIIVVPASIEREAATAF